MPTDFENMVYDLLRNVPEGKVTTYKRLAERMGTKAYRAIGSALARNPYAPEVPCHRVVSSNGKIGGFMGKKSGPTILKKQNLLKDEGVEVKDGKIVGFKSKLV